MSALAPQPPPTAFENPLWAPVPGPALSSLARRRAGERPCRAAAGGEEAARRRPAQEQRWTCVVTAYNDII